MPLIQRGRAAALQVALAMLLAVSLVAGLRAPAFAIGGITGTINGTVTDAATKMPLAGVAVTAASPSQSSTTRTDAKGFYAFAGLPVDTYTISFRIAGYDAFASAGVTVQGDQQVTNDVVLSKTLQVIGRAAARSVAQAFQPKQTTDSYQISGRQQQTALGRAGNTSQTQLQSSVPSITTTYYGSSSIRGSTRTEIAYQFDGIDYTDPLTSQFQNSLSINGVNSLQVNPGAGDATQGNAGAGAVNIVVKRGARPSFGSIYGEAVAYPFGHELTGEYGWATPNGRFSNYSSYVGSNAAAQYGPIGTPTVVSGAFFTGQQLAVNRDFINNAVYRFGHDNSRSLQFLYQTKFVDFTFNPGGIENLCYKTCDPNIAGQLSGSSYLPSSAGTSAQRLADFQGIIGLLPYQSSPTQMLYYPGNNHQPVDVMKLEFSQQLNNSTYWTNRLYRVIGNSVFNRPYDTQSLSSRVNLAQGGVRNGFAGELIKQIGDKQQATLSYNYQQVQPVYDYVTNTLGYRSLTPINNPIGATTAGLTGAGGYEIVDFIPNKPGFTCPTTDPLGNKLINAPGQPTPCGYLANYFPGGIPRIPDERLMSSGSQQIFGIGLRDQITVSSKLRLDLGLRLDGSNYQFVNGSAYKISDSAKHPRVTEPRAAFAYQLGANDAVRFSYGRSVQFTPSGTINAPIRLANEFLNVPSYDPRTGTAAKVCGPPLFISTCPNFAQQLHDEMVGFTGLEAFDVKPSTYNNFDFSYSHQFANNIGLKLTPFFKRGYGVNVYTTPVIGTDPVTGAGIAGPSTLTNLGIDKTTGVELQLTKDAPLGFSGFLALTYVNRLQNVPPGYLGQTEDFYPTIPPPSLALGNLYRAGYLSPLNGRLGVAYKNAKGWKVNPIVSYDKGFPIVGAGLLTTAYVNNVPVLIPNTNVSAPGFGIIANAGTPAQVTQYVSPTNPGSLFNPNIAATRGTPETALAGGVLSKARFNTDLDIEYSSPGSRGTVGMYVGNLFNQVYGEPSLSSRYQPVATGIAGPQTGQSAGTVLFPGLGFYNYGSERFGQNAYNLAPNSGPIRFRFYYQLNL